MMIRPSSSMRWVGLAVAIAVMAWREIRRTKFEERINFEGRMTKQMRSSPVWSFDHLSFVLHSNFEFSTFDFPILLLFEVHSRDGGSVGGGGVVAVDLPGGRVLVDLLAEVEFALLEDEGVVAVGGGDFFEEALGFGEEFFGLDALVAAQAGNVVAPAFLGDDDDLFEARDVVQDFLPAAQELEQCFGGA